MNRPNLLTKTWHWLRLGARFLRTMPAVYYAVLPEIEKQATIARLNQRFGSHIHRGAVLNLEYEEDFQLAPGVMIGALSYVIVENERAGLRNSKLVVGENTRIFEQNNIRACGGEVRIGKKCLIAQQVSIIASNHLLRDGVPVQDQAWDTERSGVVIGDDVWIGCGAIILPGTSIGNGAVIAAGSVVNGEVAGNSIVAGVPARLLKMRQ